jgi:hypothetical protein
MLISEEIVSTSFLCGAMPAFYSKQKKTTISIVTFIIIKPTRCTNSTNLFCNGTLHVSDSSSVHHQEFIHCTLSNGICHIGFWAAFEQNQDGSQLHPDFVRKWKLKDSTKFMF